MEKTNNFANALDAAASIARANTCALVGDTIRFLGRVGTVRNVKAPVTLDSDETFAFASAIDGCVASEVVGPCSALASVVYAKRLLLGLSSKPEAVIGRTTSRSDVLSLLGGILHGQELTNSLELILVSRGTTFNVDRKPARKDSVQLLDSHSFKHSCAPFESLVELSNVKVLVADAFVESVSEIHTLLDGCATSGHTLVLCTRGFSDDVLHTLNVNRARGSLNAYPLVFPFNETDANTLVDIATVVGCDVVSPLKGQLLSTITQESLKCVRKARLQSDRFELEATPESSVRASVLSNELEKKRDECDEQVRSSYDHRIRRLRGSAAIVRLEDTLDHELRVERLDLAFRLVKAANFGVVDVQDEEAWGELRVVPTVSLAAAWKHAASIANTLRSINSRSFDLLPTA